MYVCMYVCMYVYGDDEASCTTSCAVGALRKEMMAGDGWTEGLRAKLCSGLVCLFACLFVLGGD